MSETKLPADDVANLRAELAALKADQSGIAELMAQMGVHVGFYNTGEKAMMEAVSIWRKLRAELLQKTQQLAESQAQAERLREYLKTALRQWQSYAEQMRGEDDFTTERHTEANMWREAHRAINSLPADALRAVRLEVAERAFECCAKMMIGQNYKGGTDIQSLWQQSAIRAELQG